MQVETDVWSLQRRHQLAMFKCGGNRSMRCFFRFPSLFFFLKKNISLKVVCVRFGCVEKAGGVIMVSFRQDVQINLSGLAFLVFQKWKKKDIDDDTFDLFFVICLLGGY